MEKIGEGAEAEIYAIKIFGKDAVLKRREPKRYRISELDTKLRSARTKKEARILSIAFESGVNVPRVIALTRFSIYMEKIGGVLLKDIEFSSGSARRAGKILAELHNAGIVHGDFTPANLMAVKNSLSVIDFGLSNISHGSEERALDVLLMKRQISKVLYKEFISSYSKTAKDAKDTITRLDKVEERGRYQVRTLA